MKKESVISVCPIGYVRNDVKSTPKAEHDWSGVLSRIQLDPLLKTGLEGLERYSHIIVIYWAHRATALSRMALRVRFKGDRKRPMVGVFASRSPFRPNPVCQRVVALITLSGPELMVKGLDALDGSPVLDIKPFIPRIDAPPDASVPSWD